jgi:hypothetical protein
MEDRVMSSKLYSPDKINYKNIFLWSRHSYLFSKLASKIFRKVSELAEFIVDIVAYLPHARTIESRKPQNTHATI